MPVDININSIDVTTRVAKPEKLVKLPKGDTVITFKVK